MITVNKNTIRKSQENTIKLPSFKSKKVFNSKNNINSNLKLKLSQINSKYQ